MKIADIPLNEQDRLADLSDYGILDTPYEEEYEDLVKLAAKICNVPMSLITMVDAERQWFKARQGISFSETERNYSFCAHAILDKAPSIIPDTLNDERFYDNPYVIGDPKIRFYAGVPLVSHRGNRIGALCVLDRIPRDLSEDQQSALIVLSRQIIKQLEVKRINKRLEDISRMQNRLLNLVLKDIKSPMSSVGTLLNLLQDHIEDRDQFLKFTKMAAGQFNNSLSLLNSLVEWSRLYQENTAASGTVANAGVFTDNLFVDLARTGLAGNYSFYNQIPEPFIDIRNEKAVYFILRNLVGWLCESATDGNISLHHFTEGGGRVIIRMTLFSNSISQEMPDRIAQANEPACWADKMNTPVEGLPLLLTKDIVGKLKGDLYVYRRGKTEVDIELVIKSL